MNLNFGEQLHHGSPGDLGPGVGLGGKSKFPTGRAGQAPSSLDLWETKCSFLEQVFPSCLKAHVLCEAVEKASGVLEGQPVSQCLGKLLPLPYLFPRSV